MIAFNTGLMKYVFPDTLCIVAILLLMDPIKERTIAIFRFSWIHAFSYYFLFVIASNCKT